MSTGSSTGISLVAEGIEQIFSEIPESETFLLLETTAGQGSGIGHQFEEIAAIMEKIGGNAKRKIGVCLDTCHIFAAGYDIRTKETYKKTFDEFESIIGINYLYLIHLNDSKKELGSKVDRHEHIGSGHIGIDAFGYIMNDSKLYHVPKILETPKIKDGMDMDEINLLKLREIVKG